MKFIKNYIVPIYVAICLIISLFIYLTIKIDSNDSDKIKIGVTYMTMNNTFFKEINNEIKKSVNDKQDIIYTRDPAMSDKKQIQQIKEFISLKVDYIIINPVNASTIVDELKNAKKHNIKIIVVDTPLNEDDVADCTIVSNNYDAGVQCAKDMMAQLDHGNIVLIEHRSALSAVHRIDGFLDEVKKNPNFQVIARTDGLGQAELALPEMRKIISKNKDIQVVMAENDPSAIGALAALEESHLNDVIVYGVDGSPDMKKMVMNTNVARATASQSPISMGQEAIKVVYKMEKKEKYEKRIVIPITLIIKDNIDEYTLSGWQ